MHDSNLGVAVEGARAADAEHLLVPARSKSASGAGRSLAFCAGRGGWKLEAMLAAQMAAVHMATMAFARRLVYVKHIPQQDSAQNAPFRSTQRLEAGASHRIASAGPWRDHRRVDRRDRLACAHNARRAHRPTKTRPVRITLVRRRDQSFGKRIFAARRPEVAFEGRVRQNR